MSISHWGMSEDDLCEHALADKTGGGVGLCEDKLTYVFDICRCGHQTFYAVGENTFRASERA
jgi:hypothetical protein